LQLLGKGIKPNKVFVFVSITSTAWLGRSAEYMICLTGSYDRRSKLALVSRGGGGLGLAVMFQPGPPRYPTAGFGGAGVTGILAISVNDDAPADVKFKRRMGKAKSNAKFILIVDLMMPPFFRTTE